MKPAHLLHLWPLLMFAGMSLVLPGEGVSADSLDRARGGWPPNATAVSGLLLYSVAIIYSALALRRVTRHRQRLQHEFSFEEKVTLRWLRILLTLYLLLALFGLLVALVRLIPGVELWPRSIFSTASAITLFYLIAFFGLWQPDVFSGRRQKTEQEPVTRYAGSNLDTDALESLWLRLQALMANDRPYLEHELRIADLAERLETSTAHLSQVINQCGGKNFFDYVSSYRVEMAKDLLVRGDAGMAQVAQDAGFNSQSAFYRQFRKVTGLAPGEFQRQQQVSA
ncbi:MAG: AraC family transcriptional regulator [Pseudomonadota bacterium]